MFIEKDSKDINQYTEAHSYLILQAGEAIGKVLRVSNKSASTVGKVQNNTLRGVTLL